METCVVKWIIIGIATLISLTGLYLSVYREIRNIQRGDKDIQSIIYDKDKGVFNFSFAIGLVLIVAGLYTIIYSEKNNIGCNPVGITTVKAEKEARILFKFDHNPQSGDLRLSQKSPVRKDRNIIKQPSGYFDENIDVPAKDANYFALLTPLVISSTLSESAIAAPIEICFKRNNKNLGDDLVLAKLIIGQDKFIKPDEDDPECIDLCDQKQTSNLISFSLFSGAYAQTNTVTGINYGWSVPNLQTLRERKQTGYSIIHLRGISLSPLLKEANLFYYSVEVNGTPIYFDGMLPKYLMKPFSYQDSLKLDFGLENLGFSGKNQGYEKINIRIIFFRDAKFIKSIPLSLDYVALRNSDMQETTSTEGSKFKWSVQFISNREKQLFVASVANAKQASASKKQIDSKQLVYKGNKVIAIIRPPYKRNLHFGICAGVVLPNNQVQFTFNTRDAQEFKNYLTSQNHTTWERQLRDN